MKLVAISSGLACLVFGAMSVAACGGGAASVPPASMPAAEPEPQPQAKSQDGLEIGSSCGESWRPEVQRWQSAVLKAIGRDGQYELFEYVFVKGIVYVGLRTSSLELADAELEAARQVNAQFSQDHITTREEGNLLMVGAFAMPSSEGLARGE